MDLRLWSSTACSMSRKYDTKGCFSASIGRLIIRIRELSFFMVSRWSSASNLLEGRIINFTQERVVFFTMSNFFKADERFL
jgi:hypothetical protein